MRKDSVIDCTGYILLKIIGPLIRIMPLSFGLGLGRALGNLFYYFDAKHRLVAYVNVKTAFGAGLSPSELRKITRDFYRTYGENIFELFYIPIVDREYLAKYIKIEGLNYIEEAFKNGRGVILVAVHAGSWELSNIICASLGFPFNLLVNDQRYPRLNRLLNLYRRRKGCRIIYRRDGIKGIIEALKDNQAIGMTVDQGGRNGLGVKFFGKDASMSTGAVKLALKYGSGIIPVFYTRIRGPYIRVILQAPIVLKETGDDDEDIQHNLQRIVGIFEGLISGYPKEYLWSYKVWKYSRQRNILILGDGRVGHLRQAQAAAKIVSSYFKAKGISSDINTLEVRLASKFFKNVILCSIFLTARHICQGCQWLLKKFIPKDIYGSLMSVKPDIIISCGSWLAPVNLILSGENLAKSVTIMRPPLFSSPRFDLVIAGRHDNLSEKKNIAVTDGALNIIDENYLKEHSRRLLQSLVISSVLSDNCIGLLIGGDTKHFHLKDKDVLEIIKQLKSVSIKLNADILITTSRRTCGNIERLIRREFMDYPRCKLLVIANEKNIPEAIGGILGLSSIVITSPESISMISEAASSNKYVLVFKAPGLGKRHKAFLDYFHQKRYIYLTEAYNLAKAIEDIQIKKPPVNVLRDDLIVAKALSRVL